MLNGNLTPEEVELIEFICKGMTNREIGSALGKNVSTVKDHIQALRIKLGGKNRHHAVAMYLAPKRFKDG